MGEAAVTTAIVLDCDPGHDDAIALLLALASPELEQEGDRVVVARVAVEDDRGRHRGFTHSSRSTLVGSELCAPTVAAANAPAVHARWSASW